MTDTAHHKFGPSGLASYEKCPRFEKMEEGVGGYTVHPITLEGTLLHAKVEQRDVSGLDSKQTRVVENSIAQTDRLTVGADLVERELTMDICRTGDGSFVSFGTADLVAVWDDGRALLWDLKTGYTTTSLEPSTNLQLACYACAIFEKYDHVETVEAHFYLARYDQDVSHTFTRADDLDAIRLRILTIVARVKALADFSPSTEACTYCAAKGRCPALAKHALVLANAQSDEKLELDQIAAVSSAAITDPADMSRAMQVADLIDPWVKAIRSQAKEMALNGTAVPGWELRDRRGKMALGDANAVFNAVQDTFSADEFMQLCSIPLGGFKKAISNKAPRGGKQLAVELVLSKLNAAGLVDEAAATYVLQKRKKAEFSEGATVAT